MYPLLDYRFKGGGNLIMLVVPRIDNLLGVAFLVYGRCQILEISSVLLYLLQKQSMLQQVEHVRKLYMAFQISL